MESQYPCFITTGYIIGKSCGSAWKSRESYLTASAHRLGIFNAFYCRWFPIEGFPVMFWIIFLDGPKWSSFRHIRYDYVSFNIQSVIWVTFDPVYFFSVFLFICFFFRINCFNVALLTGLLITSEGLCISINSIIQIQPWIFNKNIQMYTWIVYYQCNYK